MSSVNLHPSAFATTNATSSTGSTTGTAASNSSQTSLNSLGSTFLSLLTQELKNQDPTAPVDSTQMVGQMISLNELDQTASINQLLTNTLGTKTSTSTTGTTTTGTTTPTAGAIASQASAIANAYAALHNGNLTQTSSSSPSF